MLKKRNFIFLALVFVIFISGDFTYAYKRAQIAFLGETGSGKTTLRQVLLGKPVSLDYDHTTKLESTEKDFIIPKFLGGEEIILQLLDTNAEHSCRKVLNEYYAKNVHVAIICVDARMVGNGALNHYRREKEALVETMDNLKANSEKCRIIIVLTKTKDLKPSVIDRAVRYVREELIGTQFTKQIDLCYQFPDLIETSQNKCKEVILNQIAKSLKLYGLNNLPKDTNYNMVPVLIKDDDQYFRDYEWVDEEVSYDAGGCEGRKTRTQSTLRPKLRVVRGGYRVETNK